MVAGSEGAMGVALPLRRVLESPTVAGLAESVEAERRDGRPLDVPPLVPVPRDGDVPLSFGQERLWFLHQIEEASAAYHIPGALHLQGALDGSALERSLAELWRRHESLRTTFESVDGEPVARIGPSHAFVLARGDLSTLYLAERPTQ